MTIREEDCQVTLAPEIGCYPILDSEAIDINRKVVKKASGMDNTQKSVIEWHKWLK